MLNSVLRLTSHAQQESMLTVVIKCPEYKQGLMQDKIIASHLCFGGHMDVNC